MQAVILKDVQNVAVEETADPVIECSTDVIVKVSLCAICGSDMHVYHDREKGCDHGTIMGHEITGVIVEKGRGVVGLHIGDRVVSPFSTSCGLCHYCRKGLTARCMHNELYGWKQNGRGLQRAQAEYVRVPLAAASLVKYEEYGISAEAALLSGDVLSTGYFGALQGEIKGGEDVVVVGCGPVGLMAVYSAHKQGAGRVFALDELAGRLELAEKLGGIAIDSSKPENRAYLWDLMQGYGAEVVIEAVGSPAAQKLAFQLVQCGGIISTIGVHTTEPFAFMPAAAYEKNITYKTGRCPARTMMNNTLPLLAVDEKILTSVITHRFALTDAVEAYKLFDEKRQGCVKLVMSSG